ncbi:MAG: AMP-binding protein, partial [Legionella sp.]
MISLDVNNKLARTLLHALIDKDAHFSLTEGDVTITRQHCLDKIKHYMDWLNALNVHSVMLLANASIDAICLIYALVLCNKTYIPAHTSTSAALLEAYLQTYQVDLLCIQPELAEQFDAELKEKLIKKPDFWYYIPQT